MNPEAFREARQQARFDLAACAASLGVQTRTVRYWEAGQRRIPYAAFRLLQIVAGRCLPWPGWDGFMVVGRHLVSPEGHRYTAGDLAWLSLTFRQAEAFRSMREQLEAARKKPFGIKARATCLRRDKPRLIATLSAPFFKPLEGQNPQFGPFGSPPQPDKAGLGPHLAPGARRASGCLVSVPRPYCLARKEVG